MAKSYIHSEVKLERAFALEIEGYIQARSSHDSETAWRHLERAHILGQCKLSLHLKSHWRMLEYALHLRLAGEALGQLIRLSLALLGQATGRLPLGNSGRSNVSPFERMDIPEDLKDLVDAASD